MLKFTEQPNLYEHDSSQNIKNLQPIVPNFDFTPFQFHSNFKGTLLNAYLVNSSETIDITNLLLTRLKCYESTLISDGFWYIFNGVNILSVGEYCGYFKLKLVLINGLINRTFYSNYFKLTSEEQDGLLKFGTSKQFLGNTNRYYSNVYFEKLYFKDFYLKKIEPVKENKSIDNGDGTKTFKYQRNTQRFEIKLNCDNSFLDILENINLYESWVLSSKFYNFNILEKPEITFDYDESKRVYSATIVLLGDYIEIFNCENIITFNEYSTVNKSIAVDVDTLLLVDTNTILIS